MANAPTETAPQDSPPPPRAPQPPQLKSLRVDDAPPPDRLSDEELAELRDVGAVLLQAQQATRDALDNERRAEGAQAYVTARVVRAHNLTGADSVAVDGAITRAPAPDAPAVIDAPAE